MNSTRLCALLAGALALAFGAVPAGATSFVLTPSVPETSPGVIDVPTGNTFNVILGLDDVTELQAYTLDITYDDAELTFLSAAPIASFEVFAGSFAAKGFTLDPSGDLGSSSGGRASVLAVPPEVLYLDGRTTLPAADARTGIFLLEFEATAPTADGLADLTIGILDERANDITTPDGSILPDLTATSISLWVIPEPSTALLLAAGAFALGLGRRQRSLP